MQACKSFLIVLLLLSLESLIGQETEKAGRIITHLSAQRMQGRGYVKRGDLRAANYIRKEFSRIGLQALVKNYYQPFPVRVNTFPGKVTLKINGVALDPGYDYMVNPASPALKGEFNVHRVLSGALMDNPTSVLNAAAGKVLVIDSRDQHEADALEKNRLQALRRELIYRKDTGIKAIVDISPDKLNFGTSGNVSVIPAITVKDAAFPDTVLAFSATVATRYKTSHETVNVAACVPGTINPDSFVVFTAHYDHLGLMGRHTFFPGANDNASGVALMISLAEYFQHHPQPFSVVFLAFSGEEAGLLGSKYFVENPLIDLSAIRFLINLDLVGTGSEGITVVNGNVYSREFNLLSAINDREQLVVSVRKRGEACNSDHCPFYRDGVPCFFIYTNGGIAAYHDPDDRAETLPLTAFDGLRRLLVKFTEEVMSNE